MNTGSIFTTLPMSTIGSRLSINPRPLSFWNLPPNENEQNDVLEYAKERGKEAPPKRPGDGYIFGGAIIGIISGIIIGLYFKMPWVYIIGIFVGGIAGTLIGSVIGARVIKNAARNRRPDFY